MDIAGAQARFGRVGRLTRIDVRLRRGADRAALLRELALPAGVRAADARRGRRSACSNLSRAYRVNLTVLALVALFTGAFLVFSVLALSVAQRAPQFALLGVLGLTARERLRAGAGRVARCSASVGSAARPRARHRARRGSRCACSAATSAAATSPASRRRCSSSAGAALVYGALGVVAARRRRLAAGARGRRRSRRRRRSRAWAPHAARRRRWRVARLLLAPASALALLPPVGGLPLAAYLVGGVPAARRHRAACRRRSAPAAARACRRRAARCALLARASARAISATPRRSRWPASSPAWPGGGADGDGGELPRLGSRAGSTRCCRPTCTCAAARQQRASEQACLPPGFVERGARAARRARASSRSACAPLLLDPARPAVALIARPLDDPARALPLVGDAARRCRRRTAGVYVSEAMVDLYGARPGTQLALPLPTAARATSLCAACGATTRASSARSRSTRATTSA